MASVPEINAVSRNAPAGRAVSLGPDTNGLVVLNGSQATTPSALRPVADALRIGLHQPGAPFIGDSRVGARYQYVGPAANRGQVAEPAMSVLSLESRPTRRSGLTPDPRPYRVGVNIPAAAATPISSLTIDADFE